MKATIESTDRTVIINGLNLRIWEGVTDKGVAFIALVNRMQGVDQASQQKIVQEVVSKHKKPEEGTVALLEIMGVA